MNILDICIGDVFVRSDKSRDVVIRPATVSFPYVIMYLGISRCQQDWNQADIDAALGTLGWKFRRPYSPKVSLPLGA